MGLVARFFFRLRLRHQSRRARAPPGGRSRAMFLSEDAFDLDGADEGYARARVVGRPGGGARAVAPPPAPRASRHFFSPRDRARGDERGVPPPSRRPRARELGSVSVRPDASLGAPLARSFADAERAVSARSAPSLGRCARPRVVSRDPSSPRVPFRDARLRDRALTAARPPSFPAPLTPPPPPPSPPPQSFRPTRPPAHLRPPRGAPPRAPRGSLPTRGRHVVARDSARVRAHRRVVLVGGGPSSAPGRLHRLALAPGHGRLHEPPREPRDVPRGPLRRRGTRACSADRPARLRRREGEEGAPTRRAEAPRAPDAQRRRRAERAPDRTRGVHRRRAGGVQQAEAAVAAGATANHVRRLPGGGRRRRRRRRPPGSRGRGSGSRRAGVGVVPTKRLRAFDGK